MNKEEFEKIDKVIRRERLYANVALMRADATFRHQSSSPELSLDKVRRRHVISSVY